MKIKIERSQKAKTSKKKKERIVSVGKHRKMVFALWLLLLSSISFGMYKSFTAVDQHTVHEKTVVKEVLINTSGIENFTLDFAKEYFSWKNDKVAIEERMNILSQYLTEEGLTLSQDMVRADIPTSSEVQLVKIFDVKKQSNQFVVSFLVNQKITEGKKIQPASSAYRVTVYEDEKGNSVVTSLPTMITKQTKAKYEGKQLEDNTEIDAKRNEEVTSFLETFFTLYPTASEKELEYYIDKEALPPINNNLKFVEINNPVYKKRGEAIQAVFVVKYIDEVEKTTISFQYNLTLEKEKNWKIVDDSI